MYQFYRSFAAFLLPFIILAAMLLPDAFRPFP